MELLLVLWISRSLLLGDEALRELTFLRAFTMWASLPFLPTSGYAENLSHPHRSNESERITGLHWGTWFVGMYPHSSVSTTFEHCEQCEPKAPPTNYTAPFRDGEQRRAAQARAARGTEAQ